MSMGALIEMIIVAVIAAIIAIMSVSTAIETRTKLNDSISKVNKTLESYRDLQIEIDGYSTISLLDTLGD